MATFGMALDRSGSMRGEPEQASRQVWGMLADELQQVSGVTIEAVTFALGSAQIGISGSTMPAFPDAPAVAMPSRLSPALGLLHARLADRDGGTLAGNRPTVIVITDGRIGDTRLVAEVMSEGVARWQVRYVAMYAGHRWRQLPGNLWWLHLVIDGLDRAKMSSVISQVVFNSPTNPVGIH